MKIQLKDKPNEKDIRTKKRFLLFPKIINKELRWLEITRWKEEYQRFHYWDSDSCNLYKYYMWMPTEWID